MMSDWPTVRLGDYCTKIGSGATPKGGSKVYLDKGPYTLIRSQNIYNDHFKSDGLTFIDEDAAGKLKNVNVEANDILINITGSSVARVCMAPGKHMPARVSQHVAIVRPDPNQFDSRFIRYYLATPVMQGYLLALASSGATRNALTKGVIENLEIPRPDLNIQNDIADVLSSFDEKIGLNCQTNQTLEQIAQAIFKSWFVDFEPVKAKIKAKQNRQDPERAAMRAISGKSDQQLDRLNLKKLQQLAAIAGLFPDEFAESETGIIPRGWYYKTANEVADVAIGKTPPRKEHQWFSASPRDVRWISIKDMGSARVYALKTSEYLTIKAVNKFNIRKIPDNTVLLSFKLTIGRVAITDGEMLSNEAIAHFKLENGSFITTEYLYHYLGQFDFTNLGSTSSIATAVNSKTIKNIPVLIPAREVVAAFNELVTPIFNKIKSTLYENESLVSTRNSMLPKLLSGELKAG